MFIVKHWCSPLQNQDSVVVLKGALNSSECISNSKDWWGPLAVPSPLASQKWGIKPPHTHTKENKAGSGEMHITCAMKSDYLSYLFSFRFNPPKASQDRSQHHLNTSVAKGLTTYSKNKSKFKSKKPLENENVCKRDKNRPETILLYAKGVGGRGQRK